MFRNEKDRVQLICSTMVGGDWRLAVGGWRRLAVGGGWRLAVGGGLVGGGWWSRGAFLKGGL